VADLLGRANVDFQQSKGLIDRSRPQNVANNCGLPGEPLGGLRLHQLTEEMQTGRSQQHRRRTPPKSHGFRICLREYLS